MKKADNLQTVLYRWRIGALAAEAAAGAMMIWGALFQALAFFWLPGQILLLAAVVGHSVILLRMADRSEMYRAGGIWLLAAAAAYVLLMWVFPFPSRGIPMLLFLVMLSGWVMGQYRECCGHAELLEAVEPELAEDWMRLWRREGQLLSVLALSLLCLRNILILGILGLAATVIWAAAVGVCKGIYLYRMAEMMRAGDLGEGL